MFTADLPKRLLKAVFVASVSCLSLMASAEETTEASLVADYPVFQKAQDLAYGQVLFDYHQGNFFDALTALNVAKVRSGIQGHGQHPELVEGGLLLAYGMINEAKAVFDSLLQKQISTNDKNQAWFYLGKAFYLLESDVLSKDSFNEVKAGLLKEDNIELYYEMQYLMWQLLVRDSTIDEAEKQTRLSLISSSLPQGNIWRRYLQYNEAMALLVSEDQEHAELLQSDAIRRLQALSDVLTEQLDDTDHALYEERFNLREQCLLSLGQLFLQKGQSQAAFDALKRIGKSGFLSDQALFAYAVSATNLGHHGLALEALTLLRDRPQFTPWIQQVPYALAYLYEQMQEPELAVQAYRVAVSHYESMQAQINVKRDSIDESGLIRALNLLHPLGDKRLQNDAYGKIEVEPSDFSFSHLLATEAFQRQLSDLHELYKLEYSLERWEKQLDSFETMMVERIALRNEKVQHTSSAMEEQDAGLWDSQRQAFRDKVDQASRDQDMRFFRDETQIEYGKKIAKAEATLALIPEDNRKRKRYVNRLNRVKAYYEWWLSESYSANHWRTMKEMRALDKEMDRFHKHQEKMSKTMLTDGGNGELAQRVKQGRERLKEIRAELVISLDQVRMELVDLARKDYEVQISEAHVYLQASREALARLSDQVYHSSIKSDALGQEVSE